MSGWDGFPKERERSGWHWLNNGSEDYPAEWDAERGAWWFSGLEIESYPTELKRSTYVRPIITPAQHAAEVEQARREGAEAVALVNRLALFVDKLAGTGLAAAVSSEPWQALEKLTNLAGEWTAPNGLRTEAVKAVQDAAAIRARGGSDATPCAAKEGRDG